MICDQCGELNAEESALCSKCGAGLSPSTIQIAEGGAAAPPADPDEDWKAVIGPKNREKYLWPFQRFRSTGGFVATWHWPAFFVTFFWLLYRKMWGWALAYLAMPAVITLAFGLLVTLAQRTSATATVLQVMGGTFLLVLLALFFVATPLLANWLYYRHCNRLIRAGDRALSRERQWARLDAKGGTSTMLVVFGAIGIVFLIGLLAAIALPAYHDYSQRAKMAQLLEQSFAIAAEVGARYESTGVLPRRILELPSRPKLPQYATSIDIGKDGVIEVHTEMADGQQPASFYFLPLIDASRRVIWQCRSDAGIKRFMSAYCRGSR